MNDACEVVIVYEAETVLVTDENIVVVDQGQMGPPGQPGLDADSPTRFIVPYAPSIAIDWSDGDIADITLTGNAALSNLNFKKKCLVILKQGGAGGHTVTFDASFGFGTDINGVTLSVAPGMADYIGLVYNYVSSRFDVVAFARGYA